MKAIAISLGVAACSMMLASSAAAQTDVVTIGTVSTSSLNSIDVPVYIRDTSATPLGVDQPPGSKIQSYSLAVSYAPSAPVQSVTFTRAGITTTLTPTSELTPSSPGMISLLDTFAEATNPIPFTLNKALPGDQVAHLVFTLVPGTPVGTTIVLTLNPTLTQLTDQGGTPATKEDATTGRLLLVNGAINVIATAIAPVGGPTLSYPMLALLGVLLTFVGLRTLRT